ncbi:MAG: FliA/WhiG family RNA polymerase sigma factor [Bdellovibrionales bacterium]|nr:FliA/WhiG family RNA polymerase sigma factor [Bdellovibrionales bacterium]
MKVTESLIREHIPLVRRMARALAARLPHSVDVEDLVAAGLMGLSQAIERFDPRKANSFVSFARFRIRGAMMDELRAEDWVPKKVRHQVNRLEQLLFRKDREGARKELGLTQKKFQELESHASTLRAMGQDTTVVLEDERTSVIENLPDTHDDPFAEVCRHSLEAAVREALRQLPEKEAAVLRLSYFEELNLKEIGQRLGISESRVCQLRGRALAHVKETLAHPLDLAA